MDYHMRWRHVNKCCRLMCAYHAYVTIRRSLADTAKYTGPRTFTDKKTLGPVKPVSFMVLLSEEDFSILLPFSLFRPVKLQ